MDYRLKAIIGGIEMLETSDTIDSSVDGVSYRTPSISRASLLDNATLQTMQIGATPSDCLTFTINDPNRQNYDGEAVELWVAPPSEDTSNMTTMSEIEDSIGDDVNDESIDDQIADEYDDEDMEGEDPTEEELADIEAAEEALIEKRYITFEGEDEPVTEETTLEEEEPEWRRIGIFYVDSQTNSDDGSSVILTCYDSMQKLNGEFIPSAETALLQDMFDDLRTQALDKFGIAIDEFEYDQAINTEITWPEKCSYRTALGYFAGLIGGFATCGDDGSIGFSMYSFTDGLYLDTELNYINKDASGELELDGIQCNIGTTQDLMIEVGFDADIAFRNPLMTRPVLEDILEEYNGIRFSGGKLNMPWDDSIMAGSLIRILSKDEYANYLQLQNALIQDGLTDDEILGIKESLGSIGSVYMVSYQTIDFTGDATTTIVSVCVSASRNENKMTAPTEARFQRVGDEIDLLQGRVAQAEEDMDAIEVDIDGLKTDVSAAQEDIQTVRGDISGLQSRVVAAEADITVVEADISGLQNRVDDAEDDIEDTLKGLALAENVVGTLSWLTAHSSETEDTTPVAGKSYYIRHQDRTFELVQTTAGKNPREEHWYEMDDAISNYVGAHLSLTDYGLNLLLDNTSYKIHIGTLTEGGDDGVYVIDDEGHVVSFFGENIEFDSDHAQYIGNSNAYIVFDPTGNGGQGSLIIGGSTIQMGSKSLEEILGKTLIYDHTYEYVRDSHNTPIQAIFTAFLYRGGVDVKTEYPAEDFTWYLKKEENSGVDKGKIIEKFITTGYTCTVNLSDTGYGAEIIGKFTIEDDASMLDTDGNNLADADGDNFTVRATGESVRVRDLSTSTTIFPTDKLMIVGAENEHLVTMQTLQDYLNANLNKQVLFNTTAAWDAQVQLTSQPNTLYIYTDHQIDSQGNRIAGIKVGDGNAYLIDMPFTDAVIMEHINDNIRHITAEERAFWNNKVSCYLADGDRVIFTTA